VDDNNNPATEPASQRPEDFITQHAYDRHRYNSSARSSRSKTQYGEGIDVKKIREITMQEADMVEVKIDDDGVPYATVYKKRFDYNISTGDTPTGESRVYINHKNPERSTQFPYYRRPEGQTNEQINE
jgi:hypothetical protein